MSYDSHISILKAFGAQYPVKRVLEIGCGDFSTPLFLDREFFPTVKSVMSIENYPDWRAAILKKCNDSRLSFVAWPDPLPSYDLIFVDNGLSAFERVSAIEFVAARAKNVPVIIHDAENILYLPSIGCFQHVNYFMKWTPWTALVSNDRHFPLVVK